MYKKYYQRFLQAHSGVQHYAAHSHHYWPDVTRQAMLQYWDDSAQYVDDKWDYFFSKKIPVVQSLISATLNLSKPEQIVFAPNTHDFVCRLFSCFEPTKQIKVLTTDSEFYSFERQADRLSENKNVHIEKVSTLDFADFEERFIARIKENSYDMIFLSQVFFNSGFALKSIKNIVDAVSDKSTLIVVDGYHAFMALPTDLASVEDRIFYIAGSYKYAQGGEGCCFMHVPSGSQLRPANTGWFAGFSELSKKGDAVLYSNDGLRFAGATMDFSALYRLEAALQLFKSEGITVDKIHQHVQMQQLNFRNHLKSLNHAMLNEERILKLNFEHHGHFYAFETGDATLTKKLHDELKANNIRTDFRGTRLRFGFGLYQEDCINLNYG
jgi:selenocysteine lyase/cysteine desulfurase